MAALIQFKDGVEGVTLRLERQITRLGRSADNDITIHDDLVSKYHARLEAGLVEGSDNRFEYWLEDCDSTNGTFVNDERITTRLLRQDDVVRLGINHFRFVDDENDDLAATTKIRKTWIPGVFVTSRKS